ncbi:MAG: YkgJ family cysteine cluster protein [Deltaproteobacteria bacterium]|nr:YkgJ family cysteine cluster protein [Deltaproteobacteria bacterium]MBW2021032.1 YkgJ family cysteine cluster protein [Deltaproteobacteria bacterium]MBW2075698.1 YkgJ family cysteine cluster protein [Deltaproteobacteria bacterium]RLB81773.1 MAG: YkgJ family cysteine cluster protein [Deltaproteobacteria bacterium]
MQNTGETYQDGIEPRKYTAESRFKFACHKGMECYTHCCSDLNITLTPYDIIRMKNRLGLTCDQFLAIYTKPEMLVRTRLPVVTLKMLDDDKKSCPFITPEGCAIYEDRPLSCRYYPLGMAAFREQEIQPTGEDFYFMVRESHCLGFQTDKEWTVREWRKDQGVEIYDEINQGWMEFMLRKKSFGFQAELSEESRKMFFMVSSNVDTLRRFIFESSFLDKYDVEKDLLEQIRTDEVVRLRFGFDWLQSALFGADKVKLKEHVLNAHKEQAQKAMKAAKTRC